MGTENLEGGEDWLARYLQSLSPAERVAGLSPEERVAGLVPEERVAGLAPEERIAGLSRDELILALPDDLLRAQPESVIASLSPEAQARVRARIAR